MSEIYIVLLSIVQGLTEFLPISSSAHLILLRDFLGIDNQDISIDIAVHLGSLGAVMLYFKTQTKQMFSGSTDLLLLRKSNNAIFTLKFGIATIPVIILGAILALTGTIDTLRSPLVIGYAMIIFGIILFIADKFGKSQRDIGDFSYKDAIWLGLWQALSLIPGTSRSGATMSGSRVLGFERAEGATIAMLMSIPTILASALFLIIKIIQNGGSIELGFHIILAMIMSFLTAYLALRLMMRFISAVSYTPYVIYRIALGALLIYLNT